MFRHKTYLISFLVFCWGIVTTHPLAYTFHVLHITKLKRLFFFNFGIDISFNANAKDKNPILCKFNG